MKSPKEFYNNLALTQISETLRAKTPPISVLKKIINNGDVLCSAILTHALIDLDRYINVGKSFNEYQVVETVKLILNEPKFNHLKIEDFKICFDKMKKGDFGKFYDRLDGQIVFECLNKYCSERVLEAEKLSDQWHGHRKNETIELSEANKEGQKKVAEVLKSIIKPIEKIEVEKPKREKTDEEILVQKTLKEFDDLFNKNEIEQNGQRFVSYDGKILNQTEFLKYKLIENKFNP